MLATLGMGANIALNNPAPAFAETATGGDIVDVYFGSGCFWHVQHEFVEAERKYLSRNDGQLTALAGYAGGNNIAD